MTWSVSASGTTSALTLGSETTLTTDSSHNATFSPWFSTANLALGDQVIGRIYTKILSAGSEELVWEGSFSNVQSVTAEMFPFVPSDQAIEFTLEQIAGTITISGVTGTIPDGSTVTGQTSGATAIVHVPGGGNVSGTSTVVQMLSGSFVNGETIEIDGSNKFTLAAAPTGRTYAWKLLYQ